MGIAVKTRGEMTPPTLPPSIHPTAQGRRLRALLKKFGWSQRELARRTGLYESDISKYCRGDKSIDSDKAYLIASVTGLTTDYIIWGSVKGMPPEVVRDLPRDD
jgi:transcriptional regulator with XRE-family HTH domain